MFKPAEKRAAEEPAGGEPDAKRACTPPRGPSPEPKAGITAHMATWPDGVGERYLDIADFIRRATDVATDDVPVAIGVPESVWKFETERNMFLAALIAAHKLQAKDRPVPVDVLVSCADGAHRFPWFTRRSGFIPDDMLPDGHTLSGIASTKAPHKALRIDGNAVVGLNALSAGGTRRVEGASFTVCNLQAGVRKMEIPAPEVIICIVRAETLSGILIEDKCQELRTWMDAAYGSAPRREVWLVQN